ncbi:MAG: hypothetical protein HYW25_02290 [Candidatus Aenigmarchaeota archaeon]|nr:hypothetical protein [Candidatus Aenigmarchaeota archaeon]
MTTVPELLKKKLNVQKLGTSKEGGTQEICGDLKLSDIKSIAKEKFGDDSAPNVKMVIGTCRSCGVTVDGKNAKEFIQEIK